MRRRQPDIDRTRRLKSDRRHLLRRYRVVDVARKAVAGQRLMQAAGDIFLGWERVIGINGRQGDFCIRRLWD